MQVRSIAMPLRRLYPCQWISGCYASCRGKNLSCGTNRSTDCAYKSRGILVGDIEGGGHSKRRKPAGKGAKGIPPRREVISCRARVKQVKHWTYPNMVSVPFVQIGNVGHQQRELRFPLGILHCHSLPPACWERGAKALIPTGSLYCEWRKEIDGPTCCLRISFAVTC